MTNKQLIKSLPYSNNKKECAKCEFFANCNKALSSLLDPKDDVDSFQSELAYTSSEIIDMILNVLGINRKSISTYHDYPVSEGIYIRLRVSDHGVNLSTWFKKNKEQRADDPSLPKLNKSTNIAITFAPTENECIAKGIAFPQKAINKTIVKTDSGNNVKPQFSVGHIQYASWLIDKKDIELLSFAIISFTRTGIYIDPLGISSGKVLAWQDTSNLPPLQLKSNTDTIKLNNPMATCILRSIAAQKALTRIQELSAQENHEWTEEEIDELIASYRRKKRE